jgi:hypothetical protein
MPVASQERRTLRRELRELLVNPLTSALLVMVFLSIAGSLPPRTRVGGGTVAGELINGWRRAAFADRAPFTFPKAVIYIVKEPDRCRAINPNTESWDELSRLTQSRPADVFEVVYQSAAPMQGVWAPTRTGLTERVTVRPLAGNPSPPVLAGVRAAAVQAMGAQGMGNFSHLILSDQTTTRRVLEGYFVNGLTLLTLGALGLSLRWVPPSWKWIRTRRSRARLRGGLCPHCGYPISGLEECPECGGLVPKEPGAAPGS